MLDKPAQFEGMPQLQKNLWRTAENVKHTDKFMTTFECRNVKRSACMSQNWVTLSSLKVRQIKY
jgi:hypothetical protein